MMMMRWTPVVVLLCTALAMTSVLAVFDVDKACALIRNPCWSEHCGQANGSEEAHPEGEAIREAAGQCDGGDRRQVDESTLEKALRDLETLAGCRYAKAMIQWLTLVDVLLANVTSDSADRLSAKNWQIWQQHVGPLLRKAGAELGYTWAKTLRVLRATLPASSHHLEYLLHASASFSAYANDKAQAPGQGDYRKRFSRLQLTHMTVLRLLFDYSVGQCKADEVEWDQEGIFDNTVTASVVVMQMNKIADRLKTMAAELNLVDPDEATVAAVGFPAVQDPDSFAPTDGRVTCKWQGVMMDLTKVYGNLLDDCRPHLFAYYGLFTDYVLTVTLYTYLAKYLQVYIESDLVPYSFGTEPGNDPEHLQPIRNVIVDTASTHPRYGQNGSLRLLRDYFERQQADPADALTVVDLKLILDGYIEQVSYFVTYHWELYHEQDTVPLDTKKPANDLDPEPEDLEVTKHVILEETESPEKVFGRLLAHIAEYLDKVKISHTSLHP